MAGQARENALHAISCSEHWLIVRLPWKNMYGSHCGLVILSHLENLPEMKPYEHALKTQKTYAIDVKNVDPKNKKH